MTLKGIRTATTLSELAKAAKNAARVIDKDVSNIAKIAALRLSFRLIYETPVDTTLALSNWRVGLGSPILGSRAAYFEGKSGSTEAQSTAAAYGAALTRIGRKQPKQAVHITNNLGYVVALNNGKSRQAPARYVQSIEAAVNKEAETMLRNYLEGR